MSSINPQDSHAPTRTFKSLYKPRIDLIQPIVLNFNSAAETLYLDVLNAVSLNMTRTMLSYQNMVPTTCAGGKQHAVPVGIELATFQVLVDKDRGRELNIRRFMEMERLAGRFYQILE